MSIERSLIEAESLVALLQASPVLHRAAYKVVAHWLLLRASTAYNMWAAYVRARATASQTTCAARRRQRFTSSTRCAPGMYVDEIFCVRVAANSVHAAATSPPKWTPIYTTRGWGPRESKLPRNGAKHRTEQATTSTAHAHEQRRFDLRERLQSDP